MAKRDSFPWHLSMPLLLCLGLAACDLGGDANYPVARQEHQGAPHYQQPTSIFGAGGMAGSIATVQVNHASVDNRMWRAALETISFMPLVSADAASGVVITDWYSAPTAPNQRQKVNIYVLDREVRAENLHVSVFRQQRGSDGNWVDAPSPDNAAAEFANAILARAGQLSVLAPGILQTRMLPIETQPS